MSFIQLQGLLTVWTSCFICSACRGSREIYSCYLTAFQMGTNVSPTCAVMETVWICSKSTLAAVTQDMRANTANIVSQRVIISKVIIKKCTEVKHNVFNIMKPHQVTNYIFN